MSTRFFLLFMTLFVFSSCGKEESEVQLEYGSVIDVDGQTYRTVKIGDQWWMAENLNVTHFKDGTPIPFIPYTLNDDTTWSNNNQSAYTYINDSLLGNLYNFQAVIDSRGLAPEGWHVATDQDWKQLESHLGMSAEDVDATGWRGENQADKITSEFNAGWLASNFDDGLYGSNESGFNALPAGVRTVYGYTNIQGSTAFWWSVSNSSNGTWYRYIDLMSKRIFRQQTQPQYGMSIRCVKD